MLFTVEQFTIVLLFVTFAFFFLIGYHSERRSGGFFVMFSGIVFITFVGASYVYFGAGLLMVLLPLAIYILLMGTRKAFFEPSKDNELHRQLGR